MSGQWEQYVEKAATELEIYRPDVERVVTLVGPLIAEDTRTRMVEAAAAAVKREAHTCSSCEICACECPEACAWPCPCFGDSRHWSDGALVDDAEMEANSRD